MNQYTTAVPPSVNSIEITLNDNTIAEYEHVFMLHYISAEEPNVTLTDFSFGNKYIKTNHTYL